MGMGGEYVLCTGSEDHPAARKPGVFKIELLMLMRRSPMPSLIFARYEVLRYQIAKLTRLV